MSTNSNQPEPEMKAQAFSCLQYANGFYRTFQGSMNKPDHRFDNDLLYNFAVMSVEKYFVALLARYDWNGTHHMPLGLYKEALDFEPELTESMKKTAILVGKFEAICSLDGFGYRTPSNEELQQMDAGIHEIKMLVEKRLEEI
jgi:hypothetical protein